MMASYKEKRRAIRRAIEIMTAWNKRSPLAYNGAMPESIAALEEVLTEYGQKRLPWEQPHTGREE